MQGQAEGEERAKREYLSEGKERRGNKGRKVKKKINKNGPKEK